MGLHSVLIPCSYLYAGSLIQSGERIPLVESTVELFYSFSGRPYADGVSGDVFGNYRICANYCTVSNRYAGQNANILTDPNIIADADRRTMQLTFVWRCSR